MWIHPKIQQSCHSATLWGNKQTSVTMCGAFWISTGVVEITNPTWIEIKKSLVLELECLSFKSCVTSPICIYQNI